MDLNNLITQTKSLYPHFTCDNGYIAEGCSLKRVCTTHGVHAISLKYLRLTIALHFVAFMD